jgi:hypothetical protein
MRPWLVTWLLVTLVTTVAIAVVAAYVVRQVMLVGRAAGRLRDEVTPLQEEVAAASARAAETAAGLSERGGRGGPARQRDRR